MAATYVAAIFSSVSTPPESAVHQKFTTVLYDAVTLMKQFFEELKVGLAVAFDGLFGWFLLMTFFVWLVSYLLYI